MVASGLCGLRQNYLLALHQTNRQTGTTHLFWCIAPVESEVWEKEEVSECTQGTFIQQREAHRFRAVFYDWRRRGGLGAPCPKPCQLGMHLELKKSKCFKYSSLCPVLTISGSLYSLGHVELPGWLCSNFVPHIHHCHPGWGENIFFYWLRVLHTLLILYGCGGWREWSEWGNVWGSVVGWRGPSAFSAVGSGRWLMETL